MNNNVESLMYGVDDISKIMNIGHTTAYKLVNSETFPIIKIGKKILIPKKEFGDWLKRNVNKSIYI